MQQVSQAWRAAQRQTLTPQSYIEIDYLIGDPAASADASAHAPCTWAWANTAQTVDGQDKTYGSFASFEQNAWGLDGSFPALPDTVTQDTGFVSEVLSDANGMFAAPPVITISFTQVHQNAIPGVTVRWSSAFEEYARDYTVTAYHGSDEVSRKEVRGNSSVLSIAEFEINGYDRLVIEVLSWSLPYHRARIEEISVGVEQLYTKRDLMDYRHSMSVDLVSAELPKAEIVFSLDNSTSRWNPYNPAGVTKYLLERQELTVRYGYKLNGAVEWIKAGTFYMSEWDTPTNGITATFTARDLLVYMTAKLDTTGLATTTLYALAQAAFTQSHIPIGKDGNVRWSIDSSLQSIPVTLPASFDYTCGEVVQLCANAARCVMWQDREGVFRIAPHSAAPPDYLIDEFVSYGNADTV